MKTILSTKKLLLNQRELLLNAGVSFVEYEALQITSLDFELPEQMSNLIISSQNGAQAFLKKLHTSEKKISDQNIFCVGEKTTRLLKTNSQKVLKTAQNASELAHFIIKNHKNEEFTYFCGLQRREELPALLKAAHIPCNEIAVYETHEVIQSFKQDFDGVLFFSPLGVTAFAKANTITTAFCIGETTASEARKHSKNVIVANATTVESTIAKAVKNL